MPYRYLSLAALCLAPFIPSALHAAGRLTETSGMTESEVAVHDAAMKRFSEARLGMFIHWGMWEGGSEWAMFYGNVPFSKYRKRADTFKGEKFDAKAVVALARASGMNYITFVAKHHDSFCLWDSAYSDFTSMKTAMRRDIVRELSDACKEAKMPLFIYYSLGLDWVHPDFLTRKQYLYARPKTAEAEASAAVWTPEKFQNYRKFCIDQLNELKTKYEIAGFWFDPLGAELANAELFDVQGVYDSIRKGRPDLLILNKTGITGTEDVVVGERELASIAMHYGTKDEQSRRIRELADAAWKTNRFKKAEIAVTAQGTWGWSKGSKSLPAEKMYGMLVKAAGNNANLLLNIGPLPDGSVPADVDRELRRLGDLIRNDGYPPLNTTTWKEKRLGKGEVLDTDEKQHTAR